MSVTPDVTHWCSPNSKRPAEASSAVAWAYTQTRHWSVDVSPGALVNCRDQLVVDYLRPARQRAVQRIGSGVTPGTQWSIVVRIGFSIVERSWLWPPPPETSRYGLSSDFLLLSCVSFAACRGLSVGWIGGTLSRSRMPTLCRFAVGGVVRAWFSAARFPERGSCQTRQDYRKLLYLDYFEAFVRPCGGAVAGVVAGSARDCSGGVPKISGRASAADLISASWLRDRVAVRAVRQGPASRQFRHALRVGGASSRGLALHTKRRWAGFDRQGGRSWECGDGQAVRARVCPCAVLGDRPGQ